MHTINYGRQQADRRPFSAGSRRTIRFAIDRRRPPDILGTDPPQAGETSSLNTAAKARINDQNPQDQSI